MIWWHLKLYLLTGGVYCLCNFFFDGCFLMCCIWKLIFPSQSLTHCLPTLAENGVGLTQSPFILTNTLTLKLNSSASFMFLIFSSYVTDTVWGGDKLDRRGEKGGRRGGSRRPVCLLISYNLATKLMHQLPGLPPTLSIKVTAVSSAKFSLHFSFSITFQFCLLWLCFRIIF